MVISLLPSRPVVRHERIPVLPSGHRDIRILHFSDLHLTRREGRAIAWLRSLAALEPDLVISTGDHLAADNAVPLTLAALEGLLDRPGAFVFGSNDYYAPTFKSPHHYLKAERGTSASTPPELPWRDLAEQFEERGWINLTHQRRTLTIHDTEIELRGTDDAHLGRDDYSQVAGPSTAPLTIGVTHAPYLRLLHAMNHDGVDLILAGHTHGGQWRLPWPTPRSSRALVTNCDLPTDKARGLSRIGSTWLHVSAGVGASPYAPLRIACPPEVSLLTLTSSR